MNATEIEWVINPDRTRGFTVNPIRGKCPHFGTPICGAYCYAERIRMGAKMRMTAQEADKYDELRFFPDVLSGFKKRIKPAVVFIGSMIDMWADEIPAEWLQQILDLCRLKRQHTVLFCTKNPKRYSDFDFPGNCWRGATVIRDTDYYLTGEHTFISLEPLLWPLDFKPDVKGIIVGAQTGPGAIVPKREWVEHIIEKAGSTDVFIKDNLLALYPDLPKLRELPWMK
jgi:protein gp37